MVQVVFNDAGNEADKRIQSSIASLIKNKLQNSVSCECMASHVVVSVGGEWQSGDFEIRNVTACCDGSRDKARDALMQAPETVSAPLASANNRFRAQSAFSLR